MDYRYFAFIDVLGYRAQLEQDQNNGTEEFLSRLRKSFALLDDIDAAKFHVRSISDSIFVFATSNNSADFIELLKLLRSMYTSFLKHQLLIRGGIAYDKHHQTDRITYSLALVAAHTLESKHAVTPRILIADSIVAKATNEGWIQQLRDENLVVIDGGLYQLHVLSDATWSDIYKDAKSVTESIEALPSIPADVRLKHLWLEDYLFAFKPKGNRSQRYITRWKSM